jgi:hypothetical protein
MKETITLNEEIPADRHTEDMQDIIIKVLSWILRCGL